MKKVVLFAAAIVFSASVFANPVIKHSTKKVSHPQETKQVDKKKETPKAEASKPAKKEHKKHKKSK